MKYANTYLKLADFGRELLNKKSLAEGLPLISKYVKDVIKADRCSIFIYNPVKKKLWSTLSDGVDKISIDPNMGLVGYTVKIKKPILENDVYNNPHFLKDIDAQTGYKTQNIITAPIFNSKRNIIGVLELLNKEGGFDSDDSKFMIFFAHYVSGFIELTTLYLEEDKKNEEI